MEISDEERERASSGDALADFLQRTGAGQSILLRFLGHEGMVTVFVIHEDEEHVEALPAQPFIQVRCALLVEDGVGLVVVLARIEGEVYETWENHHLESVVLEECLADLAQQEKMLFHFHVDGPEPARSIWIPNAQRETFVEILATLSDMEPWSMGAFDRAKMKVTQRHPTVQSLWDACGGNDEQPHSSRGLR